MILDLVRKLSLVDSNLSLEINCSKDGVYTFTVDAMDGFGEMYSFSSTDVMECYSKILSFIDCLEDGDKFFALIKQIKEEPLEV